MLTAGARCVMAMVAWLPALGANVLEQFDEQLDSAWEPFLVNDDDVSGVLCLPR